MSLGAFGYVFWILCFILVAFYAQYKEDHPGKEPSGILDKRLIKILIYIASCITGLGAAVVWVAQGEFVSECACDENKGFYNSYFWFFFMGASMFGNLIAG